MTAVKIERSRTAQDGAPAWLLTLGAPLIGVAAGLLIGALLILLAGADPIKAYAAMMRGAFGGRRQIEETLLKTAPLLLMGLGLTAAFRGARMEHRRRRAVLYGSPGRRRRRAEFC